MSTDPIRLWHEHEAPPLLNEALCMPHFRRVPEIGDCQVVVCAQPVMGILEPGLIKEAVKPCYDLALRHRRPLLIFVLTDTEAPISYLAGEVVVFRLGLTAKRRLPNEFPLPYLWEGRPAAFEPKPRTERPVVGFCGNTAAHPVRARSIARIAEDPRMEANFIGRRGFWAGKPGDPSLSADFFKNMEESHFVLCDRGAGNWSMRLFQTLSCGRIPALVDTDMVWPQTGTVPWSEVAVLGRDSDDLVDRIAAFYEERDIPAVQARCRAFHEENISPEGVSRNVHAVLRRVLDDRPYRQALFRPHWLRRVSGLLRREEA